jgi:hypothetical protein
LVNALRAPGADQADADEHADHAEGLQCARALAQHDRGEATVVTGYREPMTPMVLVMPRVS